MQQRSDEDKAGRLARPRRRLELVEWLLLVMFVTLEILDIVTTNRILALHGTWEANPVMRAFQMRLGPLWWLPKAAAAAWVTLAVARTRRRWPLFFIAIYCAIVVIVNLVNLVSR
jgi:Domain of unknown function (DUF5658)